MAAVLYHALNGIRVILIDFWQHGPQYQRLMLWIVVGVWLAVFIAALGVIGHAHGGAVPVSARQVVDTGAWTPHHSEGRLAPVMEKEHDRPASLDHPRAPRRPRGIPYFEKYAWLFMRFSGVALVFLALGHLFIMLMWDDGVYRIDFNYVAQRWASPFWQIWDMALLWLAMLHGANGMRTIIGDYARKNTTKFWLNSLLLLATGFTLVLGTYVLVTFDANIS